MLNTTLDSLTTKMFQCGKCKSESEFDSVSACHGSQTLITADSNCKYRVSIVQYPYTALSL